ncbi:MAG TPA: hypothetical protein VFL70_02130, partial [Bacteroidia bacterium]|nr:hypothetical protein [Bacteroidia bacterium]
KKYSYIAFPFYLLLSSLSHGLYDYFASQENKLSFICTMMIFLFTVSIYSTVLNNCLNISQHFTYKKMINQWEVIWKMLRYYIVIFLFQFLLLAYTKTFFIALKNLNGNIAVIGFIVFVVVVRLSRFKLIKGRWNKIKLELPFTFAFSTPINPIGPKLIIKGDGFSETSINQYYHENFIASPLTIKRTFIQTPKVGYIEEKVFAKRDESYYIIHLQITENLPPERFLIVPKKFGTTAINNKFPIVALLRIPEQQIKLENNDFENIKFLEWIFLKPIENKTITINQKIIFT